MPGRAPSPGEEEAELRQRIAAAREERDALLQLRHERAERLRAEAELEMARTRSAEKTAQLAASQTKLAQLKRAVSPDVALDADGAAEGLEGAPEEVQLIAAVADTIQVYRRCVAATVVPVFPQSMTLERHELATIFGSPAGYGLSDTATLAGGFFGALVGYDQCISREDLVAYISRITSSDVTRLLVAAADDRQDGRLAAADVVNIMRLFKHFFEHYALCERSAEFDVCMLEKIAAEVRELDETGWTKAAEVSLLRLKVLSVEHLPATARNEVAYTYQNCVRQAGSLQG